MSAVPSALSSHKPKRHLRFGLPAKEVSPESFRGSFGCQYRCLTRYHGVVTTSHTITSLEELARHYPAPRPSSRNKTHDCLSADMQRWLEHSPFFVLASQSELGIDCSPRGDEPGKAFCVLNANTIAIPDRRGNNRIETLRNLLIEPRVGLVFLIPGIEEALRVKGQARISVDPQLLDRFSLDGMPPATVIVVDVVSAYVQNARAIRSSSLWHEDSRIDTARVPSAATLTQPS